MYRRRRVVVGVLAIIVAAVLTLGVVLAVQAIQSVREGMTEPEPVAESPEPSAPGPPEDAGSGACPPDTTRVSASTDEDEYEEDEEPVLTIAVKNTHSADCVIDVGTERQEFVIERDGDTVWSSRYCEASEEDAEGGSNPLVFPAQSEKKTSLDWPRIPVDDSCRQTGDAFSAGEYALIVKLGEEESEPARFTLEGDSAGGSGGGDAPSEEAGSDDEAGSGDEAEPGDETGAAGESGSGDDTDDGTGDGADAGGGTEIASAASAHVSRSGSAASGSAMAMASARSSHSATRMPSGTGTVSSDPPATTALVIPWRAASDRRCPSPGT